MERIEASTLVGGVETRSIEVVAERECVVDDDSSSARAADANDIAVTLEKVEEVVGAAEARLARRFDASAQRVGKIESKVDLVWGRLDMLISEIHVLNDHHKAATAVNSGGVSATRAP